MWSEKCNVENLPVKAFRYEPRQKMKQQKVHGPSTFTVQVTFCHALALCLALFLVHNLWRFVFGKKSKI
jgi:hypothetical protein